MRQLTRKAEVGVLRACEEAALRRSIFDMFQHMKRGCTRWSWTCFLSESDRSGITVFVGHKGDEDKGSWHVHVCVKMKSMSTMTAKIDTCSFFFRSCSKCRLQLQSQRRKGLDCRSQSPSRQRHGITLAATLSHFPFSFFPEERINCDLCGSTGRRFLEAGERAGESTGSIRPMGMEVDKLEEEDAFKFDDEDPRPKDRSAEEDEGEQAGREEEGEEGRRAKE